MRDIPVLFGKVFMWIELLNAGQIELGMAAHHWLIQGTNSGNEFSFKGASIIHEAVWAELTILNFWTALKSRQPVLRQIFWGARERTIGETSCATKCARRILILDSASTQTGNANPVRGQSGRRGDFNGTLAPSIRGFESKPFRHW
jgi:hypothetical protein